MIIFFRKDVFCYSCQVSTLSESTYYIPIQEKYMCIGCLITDSYNTKPTRSYPATIYFKNQGICTKKQVSREQIETFCERHMSIIFFNQLNKISAIFSSPFPKDHMSFCHHLVMQTRHLLLVNFKKKIPQTSLCQFEPDIPCMILRHSC